MNGTKMNRSQSRRKQNELLQLFCIYALSVAWNQLWSESKFRGCGEPQELQPSSEKGQTQGRVSGAGAVWWKVWAKITVGEIYFQPISLNENKSL